MVTTGGSDMDNHSTTGGQGSGDLRRRAASSSSSRGQSRDPTRSREDSGMQLPSWTEIAQALLATVLAVITAVGANSLTRQAIHSLQEIHPA